MDTNTASIQVLVAAHKPYWMPHDSMYLPMHVGAALSDKDLGYQRDDTGDKISVENPRYCELTALYWGWKNLSTDYLGLVHYRRYFKGSGERNTLTTQDAKHLLAQAPVVLPTKRNYYISSVAKHYGSTFDPAHLEYLRDAIGTYEPAYLDEFDHRMHMRSAHIWNMMIMRKDLLDAYCSWMFPLLKDVERRINFEELTPFEARVIGRISERLIDTWIAHNNIPYVECPVVSLERTPWIKKGSAFLSAKFLGKKYTKSF